MAFETFFFFFFVNIHDVFKKDGAKGRDSPSKSSSSHVLVLQQSTKTDLHVECFTLSKTCACEAAMGVEGAGDDDADTHLVQVLC